MNCMRARGHPLQGVAFWAVLPGATRDGVVDIVSAWHRTYGIGPVPSRLAQSHRGRRPARATAGLDAAARKELTTTAAAQLHATTRFETTEDNNLRVVIDDSAVREALLTLRESMR